MNFCSQFFILRPHRPELYAFKRPRLLLAVSVVFIYKEGTVRITGGRYTLFSEATMEFSISTPALLFSAISLLMLAYTNRFLALASLVRQHIQLYRENKDPDTLKQIANFKTRLRIIKYTQIFGVTSFALCVVSMFLIFLSKNAQAEFIFAFSLVTMLVSLLLSLQEIILSIGALTIEMNKLK